MELNVSLATERITAADSAANCQLKPPTVPTDHGAERWRMDYFIPNKFFLLNGHLNEYNY
jgi:hypothetical protein